MSRLPVKTLATLAKRRLPRPKTKAGKAAMIAGGLVGGLIALDLLALAAVAVVAATAGLR